MSKTRLFVEGGASVPVTVLKVDNCQVLAVRTKEKDGYTAVQVGVGKAKAKRVAKAQKAVYAKINIEPKKKVAEFRVDASETMEVGAQILPSRFAEGQFVDIVGTSLGKGFAGVMKRHNFRGLEATHGVSVSHRSHGSTGQRQDPGRVFPGKKMAGHMGDERVTMQNLKVVAVDDANGLIMVKGGVPGYKGNYVLISDAVKKPASAKAKG